MAFSSALTLTDLNDYLGPSQACIKPVSGKDAPKATNEDAESNGAAPTQIAIDNGIYFEESTVKSATLDDKPRARTRLETAEISLEDCLACSGCLTSAESVLIGLQSVDELRKVVATKGQPDAPTHFVASISPQSLASLATKYASSSQVMLSRVEDYLKNHLGFCSVVDTTFARYFTLEEQAREFAERQEASEEGSGDVTLPMLASSCPGWICYAEKAHGELLPLISKTRSPQQMAGLLAKRYLIESSRSKEAPRIYHITIMPCYDKKLEASRQDFFDDVTKTRDVDLVITTGELDGMMQVDDMRLDRDARMEDAAPLTPPCSDENEQRRIPNLLSQPGSSSGSYLFDLIERVWEKHLASGSTMLRPALSVKTIRSADYTEYILKAVNDDDGSSRIIFKGALCYGFRNLQNLVRKLQKQTGIKSKKASAAMIPSDPADVAVARRAVAKRGGMVKRGRGGLHNDVNDEESRGYDYVEVMACPGGCVNGGGQVRPTGDVGVGSSSSLTTRAITVDVTEASADPTREASSAASDTKLILPINKSLDPEGYANGWLTPAASSTTSEDVEMGSIPGDEMSQEPEIAGWKGTAKEWVRLVETRYWSDGDDKKEAFVTSVHQGQALGYPKEKINYEIVRSLIRLISERQSEESKYLPKLADLIVEEMCQSRGLLEKRSDLLRTQYRAVQDDAVSGLAVQW